MEIIAHRGASRDAPENTLAAVQLALEQKADGVEVDVHLSKDGRIVVIHDYSTGKTAGCTGRVCDLSYAELNALDVGSWKDAKWRGEKIPELSAVIECMPRGKSLLVEIKCGLEGIEPFKKCIQASGSKRKVIIPIGFSRRTMERVKRELPDLSVYWVVEFKRNPGRSRWTPLPEVLIEQASESGFDGVDVGVNGPLTANFVKRAHQARLKVYVWTVDSAGKARQLRDAGVDGIATNRPGWMREQLRMT